MKVRPWLIGLSIFFALGIFVFDILVPLGVAAALPYVGLILLSRRSNWPPFAAILAGLATVLVILGYFVSMGEAAEIALINRGVTIFVIWLTAMLCYQQMKSARDLAQVQQALEKQLMKTTAESTQMAAVLTNEQESRSETEDRLDVVEQLYFALFNQTYQLIAVLSPAGQIEEVNDTFLAIGAYTREGIRRKSISDLGIWNAATKNLSALRAAIRNAGRGDFARVELPLKDASDNILIMDISIKPIRNPDSRIEQLIFEARDVTELKSKQEALLHAQKTEMTGRLTSGVAHDFNNILAVIAGHLEIAKKQFGTDNGTIERIEMALTAVFRGKELTEQLLTLSRKRQLEIGPTNANAVIREAAKLLDRTLLAECEIELKLAHELWTAMADATQLQTAVMNLVINACDAMPSGGTVTVKSENLSLGNTIDASKYMLTPGAYVAISVIDEGTGLTPEQIQLITEPFYTTKKHGSGTGLGLSMVDEFVRQCGGRMHIASTPGIGTAISLYLQRSLEAPEDKELPSESAVREYRQPARILVVEDNKELRENVVRTLTHHGHYVEQTDNAESALLILQRDPSFELLFTDISLPGDLDGRELADKARAIVNHLKVILTTGVPDEFERRSDSDIKRNVLAKPYRQNELARRVQDILVNTS